MSAAVSACVAAEGPSGGGVIDDRPIPDVVTWSDHVAPLIERECVTCHQEGGIGPFALTSFDDAARRAERIEGATSAQVMPPWLPHSEPGTFAGARTLSERERALIRRWVETGAARGEGLTATLEAPAAMWEPGEPDLVVELPAYTLPAEGYDVYRNLVVPIEVDETKWVEYVDLRPGGAHVVHHARMMIDTTTSSRDLAAEDPTPGFDGMELLSQATNPDGHFIGWTPGKTRLRPLDGMAWRLDPGTDLVVQLHLRATGQEEFVEAEVDFHFADEPPSEHPAVLVVSSLIIDIPPGDDGYVATNSFTLPVPVDVLSIYPHAHYLGSRLRATAVLPDGEEVPLIDIPEWDFNWQDDYRYAEPISLPAGATIVKEFSYDNSAENPRNPSVPPRRVVYGSNSDDEMADLILQVLPRSEADRDELLQAQAWQHESEDMQYLAHAEFEQGRAARSAGDLDAARRHFQEALTYRADHLGSLIGLSSVFVARNDGASALLIARQAVTISGRRDAGALEALSIAHEVAGAPRAAADAAREALAVARSAENEAIVSRLEARVARLGGP
ncbi:MAG: hypothetical protein AAF389_20695 [Gemmatimonadota bacterium]